MLLSIITINYNNAEGLKKTIQSVVSQSHRAFEYLVIDGGSTDESVAIIKENASELTWWVSEKDNGIYNAMNKGIEKATGKYLLFLNSGDWLYNADVLANCVSILANSNTQVLTGRLQVLPGNGGKPFWKLPPATVSLMSLIRETVAHPATFMHRSLFEQYGGYKEQFKIVADWVYFVEVLGKHLESYEPIGFPISVFTLDGVSSNTANKIKIQKEKEQFLTECFTPTEQELITELLAIKARNRLRNYRWLAEITKTKFGKALASIFLAIPFAISKYLLRTSRN